MSEDDAIRGRAREARYAFIRESDRARWPMADLLRAYAAMAGCIDDGEYHRDAIFRRMVGLLCEIGAIHGDVDTGTRPKSESVREAAKNARLDTADLYHATATDDAALDRVVSVADDLMESIRFDRLDRQADRLHDAVTGYLEADGREADEAGEGSVEITAEGISLCTGGSSRELVLREAPERVIFNPPATVAFWPDGTRTVAKCADGEEFSEYTGLLVAIAKRHLRVPRHAMFEDVMAKLLRRAERQRPKGTGAGDAA